MRLGKIDYLNLLPFHVFMKRYGRNTYRTNRRFHNVPSAINAAFKSRRVDAAFISSIEVNRCRCANLGIVAKKEVWSVLLIPGHTHQDDTASATSNALSRVLGLQGEVMIGDRALKAYLDGVDGIDLAELWHQRTGLPFVFARFCHHGHSNGVDRIVQRFSRHPVRIPRYLLLQASQNSGIAPDDILNYLKKISYTLEAKEERAFKKFRKLARMH